MPEGCQLMSFWYLPCLTLKVFHTFFYYLYCYFEQCFVDVYMQLKKEKKPNLLPFIIRNLH